VNELATLLVIAIACTLAAAFWRQILAALAVGMLVVIATGVVEIINLLQSTG
jgi:hypothetical protein